MKKHLTYVATHRFFVMTQIRENLKRVRHNIQIPCRDTTKERLKKERRDIAKIVTTQADHSSLKVCSNNYQIVSTEVGRNIQILCRDTKEGIRNESLSRQ